MACLTFFLGSLTAEELRARWALEANEAMVGQGLTLTLELQGSDQAAPPNLRIAGVEVRWLGGRPSNSTSMVSINGRTTTTVNKSFVGAWSLKASQPGRYHLDPIDWQVGGQTLHLSALDWTVSPIQTDARFFLRQSLAQSVAIPGLEIEYRLTWFLGQSAQNPEFNLPILDDPNLEIVEASLKPSTGDNFQTEYHGRTLSGVKDTATEGGKQYTTLSFRFRVKAKRPGNYDLSGTRVTFAGAVSTRQTQDFFGNIVEEPAYKTIAAQANPLSLQIKDLPEQGKPAVFSGLIGKLQLTWSGLQGPYRVGEPIRLGLKLDGVLNKPNLDLDSMVTQALADPDFQISPDPAQTPELGNERRFVVRARHGGRLVIPALRLNYYDPVIGRYGETGTPELVVEIIGDQVTNPVPAGSTGAPQVGALPGAGQATIDGPGSQPPGGLVGAAMNPPGLVGARRIVFPWWAWGLPGILAGLVLGAVGLWRHSHLRRLRIARLSWLAGLGPLLTREPREQLEEARHRLQALLAVNDEWQRHLVHKGYWSSLQDLAGDWDRAFFAQGREHEAWAERWDTLCLEARAWK